MRNRIHADAVLIVEGPPAIWSASLGSTIFTVTIRSRYGAIHTIKVPYSENPACWLGRLLVELEDLEGLFITQAPHRLCGRESINVGIVTAGDYFNRLPTIGTITGTWRWGPGKTFATVQRQFEELCDRLAKASGLEFSVCFEAQREPFETPREHPLVQALLAAGICAGGVAPEVIGMALVGDANLYANDGGVATVYYGPAHETSALRPRTCFDLAPCPLRQSICGHGHELLWPGGVTLRSGPHLSWSAPDFTVKLPANCKYCNKNALLVLCFSAKTCAGNQVGASSINLAANSKTAAALRDLPGLGGVVGKTGLGAIYGGDRKRVAVLGMRFQQRGVYFDSDGGSVVFLQGLLLASAGGFPASVALPAGFKFSELRLNLSPRGQSTLVR